MITSFLKVSGTLRFLLYKRVAQAAASYFLIWITIGTDNQVTVFVV